LTNAGARWYNKVKKKEREEQNMYRKTYKYFLEATILGEGKHQYKNDNLDWVNKKFDEWMKRYGERAIIRIAITDTQNDNKVVREWMP